MFVRLVASPVTNGRAGRVCRGNGAYGVARARSSHATPLRWESSISLLLINYQPAQPACKKQIRFIDRCEEGRSFSLTAAARGTDTMTAGVAWRGVRPSYQLLMLTLENCNTIIMTGL